MTCIPRSPPQMDDNLSDDQFAGGIDLGNGMSFVPYP